MESYSRPSSGPPPPHRAGPNNSIGIGDTLLQTPAATLSFPPSLHTAQIPFLCVFTSFLASPPIPTIFLNILTAPLPFFFRISIHVSAEFIQNTPLVLSLLCDIINGTDPYSAIGLSSKCSNTSKLYNRYGSLYSPFSCSPVSFNEKLVACSGIPNTCWLPTKFISTPIDSGPRDLLSVHVLNFSSHPSSPSFFSFVTSNLKNPFVFNSTIRSSPSLTIIAHGFAFISTTFSTPPSFSPYFTIYCFPSSFSPLSDSLPFSSSLFLLLTNPCSPPFSTYSPAPLYRLCFSLIPSTCTRTTSFSKNTIFNPKSSTTSSSPSFFTFSFSAAFAPIFSSTALNSPSFNSTLPSLTLYPSKALFSFSLTLLPSFQISSPTFLTPFAYSRCRLQNDASLHVLKSSFFTPAVNPTNKQIITAVVQSTIR
ncbi:hypothetical protein AX774_g1724 [Zancudomyces culisetae]|uniref:Uncharacterized protein n=1 Tax=Zancudomyces culisetae TaxID=1213189 RepID=A0A1R1PUZ1_ZANCU|nr:hypothetical protein AX774_g1724 [Zancudomyces culisetae]|eukprot:OMH84743.1 hypothetical protein AX774_g1724 [Zancudomyces culisetae]